MNTKSINDKIIQYPILNELKSSLALKNLSPITVTNYMDSVARFLDFIHFDNQFDVTEDHFRNYLIFLHSTSLSKNSINSINSSIRFFFYATLNKSVNVYRVPRARFTPKEIDFLFDHQISSLFNVTHSDSRMDCIVKLALCCGLRINEVFSLKVSDISTKDISNMTLHISESKRNKSRYVPLDNTVYRVIQRYAKEFHIQSGTDKYLFVFSSLPKTCNETLRRNFNICRNKAGIPDTYTFHCLRHTYAVNFLRAGGDLLDLKYRLGHGSLASTSRYLHFARNMMNRNISYIDTLIKDGVLDAK